MNFFNKYFQIFILIAILFAGILIRLQNFSLPPIDAHPMRQTDTECVAFNFANKDSNILRPQACLIRPQTNKDGFFFLEFPLYQYGLAGLYTMFGSAIEVARVYNLGLYLIATISLFYFVKKLMGDKEALLASFLFSFAPGSIFFVGHAIHPDVFALTTLLVSLALCTYYFHNKRTVWFLLSLLLLSASVATRPFILLVLPAYLYLLYIKKSKLWQFLMLIITSPLLYTLWRLYQLQFIEANHDWENWIMQGREILLTYQGIISQLIVKNVVGEIVGKINFLFSLIGFTTILTKRTTGLKISLLWLIGVPFYWLLIPYGNLTHQYYANVFLIPIIILSAIGMKYCLSTIKNKHLNLFFLMGVVILVTYNGVRISSYYFNDKESDAHLNIASDINRLIPEGEKIVYLASLNSVPLSLSHHQGWVLGAAPVDVSGTAEAVINMKGFGAKYAVAGHGNTDLNHLELELLRKQTTIFTKTKWVTIYKFK